MENLDLLLSVAETMIQKVCPSLEKEEPGMKSQDMSGSPRKVEQLLARIMPRDCS